ncbi:MAG: zinc-binding dehydrogenase [Dehalococcoidia bacterium]
MKAVRFHHSFTRYLFSKVLGIVTDRAYWGRFSALAYDEVPEPGLPNENWVKVKTALCGICSSDLMAIFLKGNLDSPLYPFVSFPMTLGHEIVGAVAEVGRNVADLVPGDRVAIDPLLPCKTRDVVPPCPSCQEGRYSCCQNFAGGSLPPGFMVGANPTTGGGWTQFLVAHKTQCFKIPEGIPFNEAVLIEPFSVSLHALLSHPPRDGDAVLIIGCGTLGLSAIQGMRALYPGTKTIAIAKYGFQRKLAATFGAEAVLPSRDRAHSYQEIARLTQAKVCRPLVGKPILMGGVDRAYDFVGSGESLEDGLRLTRAGGTVVVIGVGRPERFEWSPLWFKEIHLAGSMSVGLDEYRGERRHTFEVALDLISKGKVDLSPLLTHVFPLPQYREAIRTCSDKRRTKMIKVAFSFR